MDSSSKRRRKSESVRSHYREERRPSLGARLSLPGANPRLSVPSNLFTMRLRRTEPRTWTGTPIHSPLITSILPLSPESVLATFQMESAVCIYSETDASLFDSPRGSYRQLKRLEVDRNKVYATNKDGIDMFDLEKQAWVSWSYEPGWSLSEDIASDGQTFAYLTIPQSSAQLESPLSICCGDMRMSGKPKPLFQLPVHNPSITTLVGLKFLGDDTLKLVLCSVEGEVMVWDLRMPGAEPIKHRPLTGAPVKPRWCEDRKQILPGYSRHVAPISCFIPSNDGRHILTTSSDGLMKIWSTMDFCCVGTISNVDHQIQPVIAPSGDTVYFWSDSESTISELSLESYEVQHSFSRPASSAVCLGLSHESGVVDGLFTGNVSGRITVYNYRECD